MSLFPSFLNKAPKGSRLLTPEEVEKYIPLEHRQNLTPGTHTFQISDEAAAALNSADPAPSRKLVEMMNTKMTPGEVAKAFPRPARSSFASTYLWATAVGVSVMLGYKYWTSSERQVRAQWYEANTPAVHKAKREELNALLGKN
jgi:hypothetical protein